jgi:hypothetical protein
VDFQGMGNLPRWENHALRRNAKAQGGRTPAHPPRTIAVSFHRLFLGGLLPSRARFRFTGQHHSISILTAAQPVGHVSEQVSAMSSERTTSPAMTSFIYSERNLRRAQIGPSFS